jgi:pimeloyl-ACP methyl ester carboxylesterase
LSHGAFAESASWGRVIDTLLNVGRHHRVIAAANPLRGVAADAHAITDVVRTVDGPVLLVGHSYGGSVISNVDADAGEIVGLVYVAGFAPEVGESAITLSSMLPGSTLGDALQPIPRSDGTTDLTINVDQLVSRLLHLASGRGHEAHPPSRAKDPLTRAMTRRACFPEARRGNRGPRTPLTRSPLCGLQPNPVTPQ